METVLNYSKKIGQFFTGIFNIASYAEQQNALNNTLKEFTQQITQLNKQTQANGEAIGNFSNTLAEMNAEIDKLKEALQIELFGSLQALHSRLISQHYATPEQKREAQLYYEQIHKLGRDGWSQKYLDDIIDMPESKQEYWKSLNN